ncbi:hypothetical protein HDU76_003976, partial [Blyttiomyces sp. JEL0837]
MTKVAKSSDNEDKDALKLTKKQLKKSANGGEVIKPKKNKDKKPKGQPDGDNESDGETNAVMEVDAVKSEKKKEKKDKGEKKKGKKEKK